MHVHVWAIVGNLFERKCGQLQHSGGRITNTIYNNMIYIIIINIIIIII